MKYKKHLERLEARQQFWERQSATYQKANKKPGSKKKT